MPTPANTLALNIGGKVHTNWQSYEIDSDLMIAADAWQFDLAPAHLVLPEYVDIGKKINVTLDGEVILKGVIDDINEPIGKGQHTITLSGRDLAGQLLDCSAPVFDAQQLDLKQILNQFLKPFNINHSIEAASTAIREKVTVDVGETVWEVISKAAEANGLWQWFAADGTLTIGEPNPKTAIVAHLVLRRDGVGNNLESLTRNRSLNERYSDITVLAQSSGNQLESGKHDISATVKDEGLAIYRPKIITSGDCENIAAARAKAKKTMVDGQLNSYNFTAVATGHYNETGSPWQPRQRITLFSEPHGVNATFFIIGRKFKQSRTGGKTTELRLKQDGIWQIAPYKSKNKKRKGKKAAPFEDVVIK